MWKGTSSIVSFPFVLIKSIAFRQTCEQCGNRWWVAYHCRRKVMTLEGLWQVLGLGQRPLPGDLLRSINVKDHAGDACSIDQLASVSLFVRGAREQISEKERTQSFCRSPGQARQKARELLARRKHAYLTKMSPAPSWGRCAKPPHIPRQTVPASQICWSSSDDISPHRADGDRQGVQRC